MIKRVFTGLLVTAALSAHAANTDTWIKVLIAQYTPQKPVATYVSKVVQLAPNLEQFHVRVNSPTNPGTETLLTLISKLHSQEPNVEFGFHPDNSKHSAKKWGCTSDQGWQCVFSKTINYMNQVNSKLKAQGLPVFTHFSIEQGYVEPLDSQDLKNEKACLTGTRNNACMTIAASPAVKYGNVLPSCGSPTVYGQYGFDESYPQFYNMSQHWTYNPSQPIPFKSSLPAPLNGTYLVLDANTACKKFPNSIPTMLNKACASGKGTTVYKGADTQLASNYVGWIIAHHYTQPRGNNKLFPCYIPSTKGVVYMALSGEPTFLGGPKWTPAKLQAFHTALLATLKDNGVVNTNTLKFAIWNFSALLGKT